METNTTNNAKKVIEEARDAVADKYDKLAEKVEKAAEENKNGNPFAGIKFTDEEREYLASCGIV